MGGGAGRVGKEREEEHVLSIIYPGEREGSTPFQIKHDHILF
jgi:hypothetical protein